MKSMKNDRIVIIVVAVVLAVAMLFAFVGTATAWGNQSLFDMTYRFDRAVIMLPNEPDGYICGMVESWQDYENSDVVQVKIDGKVYLTHYSNVVLIDD